MKVTVVEFDGCFSIDLIAESTQEAATLVRLGMNATRNINHRASYVDSNGVFSHGLVWGKSKRANNNIPERK